MDATGSGRARSRASRPNTKRSSLRTKPSCAPSSPIVASGVTKGQKAMAYAVLFPEPPTAQERGAKGGRGKKGVEVTSTPFSDKLLQQARAVLRHAPTWPKRSARDSR
jgi:hypothetical protein